MDFALTADQLALRDTVRRFVCETVTPAVAELEAHPRFPRELFEQLGELGVFGLRHRSEDGGLGADLVTTSLVVEELAQGYLSLASAALMQMLMGTYFLGRYGSAALKDEYLGPAIAGTKIGAICMTEPDAGSDLGGITTRYLKEGDDYLLSGAKTWVSNGTVADFFTVLAAPDPKSGEFKRGGGFALFFVPRATEGLSVSAPIPKLGVWGLPSTDVRLTDLRVPKEQLLVPEGEGMKAIQTLLVDIRTLTGSLGLGLGRAALKTSLDYAKTRETFGRPIASYQLIKDKLATMATDLEAATLLVHKSAWCSDTGAADPTLAAMAKRFATEAAARAADACTRVLASYGFAMEYPAQRFFRDARFLLSGGGTSEILALVIAKGLSA